MIEKKLCLSIDQMRKMSELGIPTKEASMCWVRDGEGNRTAVIHDEFCYEMSFMNPVPAFTLQDMLDIMPYDIFSKVYVHNRYFLKMEKHENKYMLYYWNPYGGAIIQSTFNENAIDSAFELLCWLAENKLLK